MAKKSKTTLKDVSNFLKSQPSTLVKVKSPGESETLASAEELNSKEQVIEALKKLSEQSGRPLGSIVMEIAEEALEEVSNPNAEEVMLLNTILYLRHYSEG